MQFAVAAVSDRRRRSEIDATKSTTRGEEAPRQEVRTYSSRPLRLLRVGRKSKSKVKAQKSKGKSEKPYAQSRKLSLGRGNLGLGREF